MTVRLFILILLFPLISCTKKDHIDFELVSYRWSMKHEIQKDTLTPYLKCNLYAQINKNGDCILTKTRYQDNDLHLNFTIEKKDT